MQTRKTTSFFFALLFLTYNAFADNKTIVFGAQWLPQAQFAGYYVAHDQGFYADAGIDVEIIHPTATVNTLEYLISGQADVISLFLITAINNRCEGLELINIGQLSQQSAIMFVSRKSHGIETLEDFEGKSVGVWLSGFQEVPYSLMADNNINVEWVPILGSVNLFLLGGLDAMTVMWYNEYKRIYLAGVDHSELNTFFVADYNYNVPEDGFYVLPHTLEEKSDALKAFLEASLRGWEYAAANRQYTIDLVVKLMREAHVPANYAHQRWMLDKILEQHLAEGSDAEKLHLHKSDFEKALEIIQDFQSVATTFTYDEFYKPIIK